MKNSFWNFCTLALICCFCYEALTLLSLPPNSTGGKGSKKGMYPGRSITDRNVTERVQGSALKPSSWRDWVAGMIQSMAPVARTKARSFVVDFDHGVFLKDEVPFRIVAGSMHYFKVSKAAWKDRLLLMKGAGINAVHTCVEWSGHEPEKRQYYFSGNYDIQTFLRTVQNVGMLVVLCVGPYIGPERDNGGLPHWLFRGTTCIEYRKSSRRFAEDTVEWLNTLLPMLTEFLYYRGGPIIAVQVENQLDSDIICDSPLNLQAFRHRFGDKVVLLTGSQSGNDSKCGEATGTVAVVELGPGADVPKSLGAPRKREPNVVILRICTADRWGLPRAAQSTRGVLSTLRDVLQFNASVILNTFHGGTNFGFRAGLGGAPYTTSSDCGAPLSEAGDPSVMFLQIRELVLSDQSLHFFVPPAKLYFGYVPMRCGITLGSFMAHYKKAGKINRLLTPEPATFETLGQDYVYASYRTSINFRPKNPAKLQGLKVRDRGYIYFKTFQTLLDPAVSEAIVSVSQGDDVHIVVENFGRSCTGEATDGPKGLLSSITLDGVVLSNWTVEAIPITREEDIKVITSLVRSNHHNCLAPSFYVGHFKLKRGQKPLDTFLDMTGWTKGVAYINGFNLGRYWPTVGPQVALYVPGSLILPHPAENTIILFEMEGESSQHSVRIIDEPKFLSPS